MLSYVRSGGVGSSAIWTAACDCGAVVEVVAKDVAAGKKRTCGRCASGLGIAGPEAVVATGIPPGQKRAFRALVRAARKMPGPMQFTTGDYRNLLRKPCAFCNRRASHVEWNILQGPARPDNMAPLCEKCAYLRRGFNLADLLEHVVRIGNNTARKLDK